jgi:hypothetical protein
MQTTDNKADNGQQSRWQTTMQTMDNDADNGSALGSAAAARRRQRGGGSAAAAAAAQWWQRQLCSGRQLGDGFCYIMIG